MEFSPVLMYLSSCILTLLGLVIHKFIGWNPVVVYTSAMIALPVIGIFFAVSDLLILYSTGQLEKLTEESSRVSILVLDWLPSYVVGSFIAIAVEGTMRPIRTIVNRPRW
jgi:hypothetical protein